MNYSTIQLAREQLKKIENEHQELVEKVNISLFSSSKTNFSIEKKNRM
ncbi:MAG: hypothetical protein NY202_04280 [Mollicutes bacterium UO1]